MNTPDAIERELILPVPRARVWDALTQPDGLSAWFGTSASVDLQPGGDLTFIWDDPDGTRTSTIGVVEVVEPLERFAFHWRHMGQAPADDTDRLSTRVEFTLADHPQGTHLRMVESGFASLPPAVRTWSRERNTRGWDHELAELQAYLAGSRAT